jgi:hypothetical protein
VEPVSPAREHVSPTSIEEAAGVPQKLAERIDTFNY